MGEVEVDSVELDFENWMWKVSEKITFLRLSLIEHKDISDDYFNMIRMLKRSYDNGEYPLYQAKMIGNTPNVMQNSLFTDRSADCDDENGDGTLLEREGTEPKE